MSDPNHHRGKLGTVLLIAGLLLVANAAYLAAFGDADIFYVANSLIHPALGIFVAILFVVLIFRNKNLLAGFTGGAARLLLAVSTGFGLFLAVLGMIRPHSLALYLHVGFAIGGLFFLLLRLNARRREVDCAPALQRAWSWCAVVMPAALVFYGAVVIYHRNFPDPDYIIRNPASPPLTMEGEGGGEKSFMFPSSAQTPDGKPIKSEFFMDSNACGRCHQDIYNQWKSSMHHFASFNNQWYRKSIEYMQDTIGIKSSMWCAGCHDHALSISDMMQKKPVREVEFTRQGQNGLGCMSCHAIVHVDSTMGQGGITFQYPQMAELAESKNPIMRYLHDYQVYLDPKPHRNAFLKPFHKNDSQVAEFCSSCHKVHLDVPVNHYRWIRGFDDYDNWQGSGVSGNSARSFYYPPKPQVCVDCHMPLEKSNDLGNINGFVHSHRFAAANTAVPTAYGDKDQVKAVEDFLKGSVTVDLFAITEEPEGASEHPNMSGLLSGAPQTSTMFAVGEESARGFEAQEITSVPPAKLMAPLNRGVAYLRRGETARVEVVVRTKRVGHFFPGGTVDAFDCWVELKGVDDKGHVIYWSGEAADNGNGPVDPGAHYYRSLSLDEQGNWINKRNAWSAHATVYARLIPPGAADTVHFRIKVPTDCGDKITFTARLNYRKFDWWLTQWAFAGERDPNQKDRETTASYDNTKWLFNGDLSQVSARDKKIPDVPTVVMSEDKVTVPVLSGADRPFEEHTKLDPDDRSRWNDYGIGLLLQGDLKGAGRAFDVVTRLDPKYADGFVNVARALVQEGNTDAAVPYLEKATKLDPKLASAYYFMGQVHETTGDYPNAYTQYAKAAAIYPGDRVVSNAMAHILFLQRKYDEAVRQYQHTLTIDPEDLDAHYNLMLCYRGLQDSARSDHEKTLYLRFKANEIARSITGPYMLANPADNNESLSIHEHVSINEEPPTDFKFYRAYGQKWDWLPGSDSRHQVAALDQQGSRGHRRQGKIYAKAEPKIEARPAHGPAESSRSRSESMER